KGNSQPAGAEPGYPESATELRRISACHVHQRQDKNGRVREPARDQAHRMVRSGLYRLTKWLAPDSNISGLDLRESSNETRFDLMYHTILIPVENRETDNTILEHIRPLARLTNAKLLLVHVADGWVARNFEQLKLQESDEMKKDR